MADQFQRQTQGRSPTSEVQIQVLREELDTANKKVDQYVNLVATLCEELRSLRRGICHNCKQKFVPFYSPAASSSGGPRPLGGQQTHFISSGLPPVLPSDAKESPTVSIPVHSVTTLANQAKTPPISPLPQASQSSAPLRQPSTKIQFNQPDWTVARNPEIKQSLHIALVKTFSVTTDVICLKFSPNGKYLAVGDNFGKTNIYDVENGLNICVLVDYSLKVQLAIRDVQFSPDGQYLATAGSNGVIRVWKIARKRTISIFRRFNLSISSTSFSPEGRFLVSGDSRGSICKWRIRDGYSKILLPSKSSGCLSVSFSPNGLYIASVDLDGDLRIWGARTNQLVHHGMGHTDHAYCLAFTPDGNGLLSGGRDKTLKYLDVSSLVHLQIGQRLVIDDGKFLHFVGHRQLIRSVAVCPDNRWIVSSSNDRSVRIWDARTATWQCTIRGHTKVVPAVDFSQFGRYLASGSGDGQVRLWRYRPS